MTSRRSAVPWAMVWLRVALCSVIVAGAQRGWPGPILGTIVLVALLDDVFDGILARRWHCDTPSLRLADSAADTIFYLGVAASLWLRESQVLRGNWRLLAVLAALEATRYAFDFAKYGKAASYHSYLAKLWGLVMGVAVIALLSFGGPRSLIWVSIFVGIAANLEGFAMSLMLPYWKNDVRTLARARTLRRKMLRVDYAQEASARSGRPLQES